MQEVKDKVASLQFSFETMQKKIDKLNKDIKQTITRLSNAEKLIGLLGDEGERWKESAAILKIELNELVGSVFISSAAIAYIGPFTGIYRDQLTNKWTAMCKELGIPTPNIYSLQKTLGEPI